MTNLQMIILCTAAVCKEGYEDENRACRCR